MDTAPVRLRTESLFVAGLGFAMYVLVVAHTLVLMNTVYTNEGLEPSDIPYWNVESGTAMDRWQVDYVLQWISISLAMAVPPLSVMTIYMIVVHQEKLQWLLLGVTLLAAAVWGFKFAVWDIVVTLPVCSKWGSCADETDSTEGLGMSSTFTLRLITDALITVILFIYLFMAKEIKSFEEEQLHLVEERRVVTLLKRE